MKNIGRGNNGGLKCQMIAVSIVVVMCLSAFGIVTPTTVVATENSNNVDDNGSLTLTEDVQDFNEIEGPWLCGNITAEFGEIPQSLALIFFNRRTGENAVEIVNDETYVFSLQNFLMGYEVGDQIYIEALVKTGNGKINIGDMPIIITDAEIIWTDLLLLTPPATSPPMPHIEEYDFNEVEEDSEDPIEIILAEPGTRTPLITYNLTLVNIKSPTGILYVGKRAPLQFILKNEGPITMKATADFSVLQPDGSEVFLGTLNYNIPSGKEMLRTLIWMPEQGKENTIIVKISYEENGEAISHTRQVGFWVIPEGEDVIIVKERDKLPDIIHTTIIIRDSDLTIGTSPDALIDHLRLGDDTLIMENTGDIDGQYQILVESDGVLEAFADSFIRAPDDYALKYKFNVYGTLIIDASTAQHMWGDNDLSLEGGIIIHPGATVEIRNGATVSGGKTHNIWCTDGSSPIIRDSIISMAGTSGGHGIVIQSEATPTIDGNTFTDNMDYGILVNSNMNSLSITNNVFTGGYDAGTGIFRGYAGITLYNSNSVCSGNTIDGCAVGILAQSSSTPTIESCNIINCVDDPTTTGMEGIGIYVGGSSPLITTNTIDSNIMGVYATTYDSGYKSTNPSIVNNPSISLNTYGIYLRGYYFGSIRGTIQNNPIMHDNQYGIVAFYAFNLQITSNVLDSSIDGIRLTYSNTNIDGNIIESNGYGIYFNDVETYLRSKTVVNNFIRYNPTGIYISKNQADLIIESNSIIGIEDKTQIGIASQGSKFILRNNNQIQDCLIGVQLSASKGSSISGNLIEDNTIGIYFDDSSAIIDGNNLIYNNQNGIYSQFCKGTDVPIITGNTITGNENGVISRYSEDIIYNNIQISDNTYGIVADNSAPIIKDNHVISDNIYGIYSISATPTIIGNTITGNEIGEYGISAIGIPALSSQTLSNGASSKLCAMTNPAGSIDTSSELLIPKEADVTSASITLNGQWGLSDSVHEFSTTGSRALNTTDYNGNGFKDIISRRGWNPSYLEIYENDGMGAFSLVYSIQIGYSITAIASGDFNNDGYIDFIVGTYKGGLYYLERTSSSPTIDFVLNTIISENDTPYNYYEIFSITAGDFDMDGNLDFFRGSRNHGYARFYKGDGAGNFVYVSSKNIGANAAVRAVTAIDMDGDGYPEVLATYGGDLYLYEYNQGSQRFDNVRTITTSSDFGIYSVSVGDINGDGYPDILVSSVNWEGPYAKIDLFLNNHAENLLFENTVSSGGTFLGGTLDYDHDGYDEVIAVSGHQIRKVTFPSDIALDIGNDGTNEWQHNGPLSSTVTISDLSTDPVFHQALNNYLGTQTGDIYGRVKVPLALSSQTAGRITVSNIQLNWNLEISQNTIETHTKYGIFIHQTPISIDTNGIINNNIGIHMDDVTDSPYGSIIKNNYIASNYLVGIELRGSSPVISENHIESNRVGVGTYDTSSPLIIDNYILLPTGYLIGMCGIDVRNSVDSTITKNLIVGYEEGTEMYCIYSDDISINDNIFRNARGALYVYGSQSATIHQNIFESGKSAIWVSDSNVDVTDNSITTEHGIFAYRTDARIIGNSIMVTGDINPETGIMTGAGPVIISENIITGSGRGRGVFVGNIKYPYANAAVSYNTITGFDHGIDLRASSTSIIDHNTIYENNFDGIFTGGTLVQYGSKPVYTITNCEIFDNGNWGMNFISNAPTNADTLEADNPLLGNNGLGKIHQEWKITGLTGAIRPYIYTPMHVKITELDGETVIFEGDIPSPPPYTSWNPVSIPTIEYELLNTGSTYEERMWRSPITIEAESYGEYYSPPKTQIEHMDCDRNLWIMFYIVEDTYTFLMSHPVPGYSAKNYMSFPLMEPKVDGRLLHTVEDLWGEIDIAGGIPQEIRMWEPGIGWWSYVPGDPVFDIRPDYAYEITYLQPFSLAITGYLPGYRYMDLQAGTNYIGWTTHHTEIKVSTFETLLTPQNLDTVYRWSTVEQMWISMSPSDFLYPGRVYMVVTSDDCALAYNEAGLVDEVP